MDEENGVLIITAIENYRKEMKEIQRDERKLGDAFINGYNCGIQDGLEAAINIIKKITD
jgi:hypothetical protein